MWKLKCLYIILCRTNNKLAIKSNTATHITTVGHIEMKNKRTNNSDSANEESTLLTKVFLSGNRKATSSSKMETTSPITLGWLGRSVPDAGSIGKWSNNEKRAMDTIGGIRKYSTTPTMISMGRDDLSIVGCFKYCKKSFINRIQIAI